MVAILERSCPYTASSKPHSRSASTKACSTGFCRKRHCNERDGITEALICCANRYLQWLEGTEPSVRATYGHIEQDSRHVNVRCLVGGPSVQRLFPDWALQDGPARSWLWSSAEVVGGSIERAARADLIRIFERVAEAPA